VHLACGDQPSLIDDQDATFKTLLKIDVHQELLKRLRMSSQFLAQDIGCARGRSAGEDKGTLRLDSLDDGPQRGRFARSGIPLKNSQPILRG
jgi:hypothetical protein